MIRKNWIHHNWGVGGWADTNNANTTWTGNTITDNENGAIWEEISYNFSITDNYIARNNLTDGPSNPGFPMAAVYVSESGSDSKNGGVPQCRMPSCVASRMPGHPDAVGHRKEHPRGQRRRGVPCNGPTSRGDRACGTRRTRARGRRHAAGLESLPDSET